LAFSSSPGELSILARFTCMQESFWFTLIPTPLYQIHWDSFAQATRQPPASF
jgi:hypothetical protein